MDHGPVPVDPLEVEETKKIQLIEQKKRAIRDKLILNIEKSKKRQFKMKPLQAYVDL